MKTCFVLAAALFATAACTPVDPTTQGGASLVPHQVVDRLPDELGMADAPFTGVVIYGDKGYTGVTGSAFYPGITVDGKALGKCEKRRAFVVPLAPGAHQIVARSENRRVVDVDLKEGEVAYLRCNFMRIGGILKPPAVLEQVGRARAYSVVNN